MKCMAESHASTANSECESHGQRDRVKRLHRLQQEFVFGNDEELASNEVGSRSSEVDWPV